MDEALNDAGWYFREFVLPNYREFLKDQLSARRAFNAAVAIAHVVDHMVIRSGGKPGVIGNERKRLALASPAFKQVEAMNNAFKHVYATGGGSPIPIATTSDVSPLEPSEVVFEHPIDGELQEFRPVRPLLVCRYREGETVRNILVGWTLFGAIQFLARELDCLPLLGKDDLPDQCDFTYRSTPSTTKF
jgi:hypothetical protein